MIDAYPFLPALALKIMRQKFEAMARYGLYPTLAAITLVYLSLELARPQASIGKWYGIYLLGMVIALVCLEAWLPLRGQWKMTSATFWRRDLPFLILGASTIAITNYTATMVATHYSLSRGGTLASVPLLPGVLLALLTTDYCWYWVHRFSHTGSSKLGAWMWRVHAAHHMPAQVYVLMHAIGHPINAVMVRAILTLPLYFLGFSIEVVFVAGVVTGFQGLVSHWNIDSRVGWLNYFLVGTELHRFHHSADPSEAKNFCAVLPVWDLLFGSFYFRPGALPDRLGLHAPELYPHDTQLGKVIMLPLRGDWPTADGSTPPSPPDTTGENAPCRFPVALGGTDRVSLQNTD
jgi:sterol desaturase/sphingolipid hydroxylase (fatty acid hydroxylase superfamily)